MVGRGSMTEEHKMKIKVARDAYWARVRAEKAAMKGEAPLAPHIQGSDLGPDPDQKPLKIRPGKSELTPREVTQRRVHKKIEKLLDAQIDAATGLYYVTKDGKHVYTKVPDTSTGQYLLNQLIGKPKESIEVKSINLKIDI